MKEWSCIHCLMARKTTKQSLDSSLLLNHTDLEAERIQNISDIQIPRTKCIVSLRMMYKVCKETGITLVRQRNGWLNFVYFLFGNLHPFHSHTAVWGGRLWQWTLACGNILWCNQIWSAFILRATYSNVRSDMQSTFILADIIFISLSGFFLWCGIFATDNIFRNDAERENHKES